MQGPTNITLAQAKSNLKTEIQQYYSLKNWLVQLCESFLELLAKAQANEKGLLAMQHLQMLQQFEAQWHVFQQI